MSNEGPFQPHDQAREEAIQPPTPPPGLPVAAPDAGEEEHADEMDDVVPTYGYHHLPVVGLGGSAGGIQALKRFFAALPPGSTGMAYVVILHLSPEHESTLPELLQSLTSLPIKAAEDGERLEVDHVYVIPPRKHLTMTNGHLRLTPLEPAHGKRVAVDLFFRTLADTHGPHAMAVVLSGADSDGAIGIKRIKERGGLTVAQEPSEAEQEGMPRAAIATGMVDWVLPVADMPARLVRYRTNESQLRLPPEEGPQPAKPAPPTPDQDEHALREVLMFLRTRTGSDFTYYKRATILRRLARRMQINEVTTLPAYLDFLRTRPGESGALLQDLLVSVTNFFRDREAFAVVEAQIPSLFAGKGPGDTVRVWSAACATGEEPYSLAMLLHEHARRLEHPPTIQVFGCDLDEQAIQTARAGLYPPTIAADVSEERLGRFFTREPRGYRVKRELRESVLLTQHDLLKDAPFSRMDLVSCRNLLIYLDGEAQSRAMDIFHFALKPDGLLFLGSAESVNEDKALFAPLDKKHCLFVRRAVPRVGLPVPTGTGTLLRALQAQGKEAPVVPPATFVRDAAIPFAAPPRASTAAEQAALAELHFKLTEHYAPPSLIVNAEGDIVHLSEHVGRFLRSPGGQATNNFLQMVLPALRMDLRAALLRVEDTRAPVEVHGVAVELEEGVTRLVDVRVAPAAALAPGYVLVSFAARAPDAAAATEMPNGVTAMTADAEAVVRHLERELEAARARLRDTVERAQSNEEEYKSSNEELRSAGEELETSREELQSLNEELTTVNHELKHNVEEAGQANSDLHNLMNATAIATVFLNRELKVLRYTPAAVGLFNLIPSDVGRPLGDLKHRVDYPELEADARQVLRTLVPVEREVSGPEGSWLLARLLPYRSLDDRIEGVVLTFVDVTERKCAEQTQAFRLKLSDALRPLSDPVAIQEAAMQTLGAHLGVNRAFYGELQEDHDTLIIGPGYSHELSAIEGHVRFSEFDSDLLDTYRLGRTAVIHDLYQDVQLSAQARAAFDSIRVRAAVGVPLVKEGKVRAIVSLHQAVPRRWTEAEIALLEETAERTWAAVVRAKVEEKLRASEEQYRTLFDSIDEGFCTIEMIDDEAGAPVDYRFLSANPAFVRFTGLTDAIGHTVREFAPQQEQFWFDFYGRVARTGEPARMEHLAAAFGGTYDVYAFRVGEPEQRRVALLFNNITERKRAETNASFLDQVTKDIARLNTPDEIMRGVGARIGEYLKLSGCCFNDVDEARNEVTIQHNWTIEGVPDLKQTYRLEEYLSAEFNRAHRAGETVVVNDTGNDPRTDGEAYARLKVGAFVTTPYILGGRWTAFLAALDVGPRTWRSDEIELLQELSVRIFARVERARAEEALAKSEEQYRTLFNSLDEGVATMELILDGEGRTTDWLYLEHNPALARLTGITENIVGKKASDLYQNLEPFWMETFGRVVREGVAERFEYGVAELGDRWFDVYAARVGGAGSRQLVVVYNNITERKRHEASREYLLKLGDVLRSTASAVAVEEAVAQMAMEHFAADRCYYVTVEGNEAIIRRDARRGDLPSVVGTYPVAAFEPFRKAIEEGQPVIARDVRTTDLLSELLRQTCLELKIFAFADVPVIKNGKAVGIFVLSQAAPRDWKETEIELMAETAERTWAAVERARAEAALRESEARTRALAENLPGGAAFIFDRQLRYVLADGEAMRAAGFQSADFLGKKATEAVGAAEAAIYEPYLRAALAGEPFVHEHASHGAVFVSRGAPLRDAATGEVTGVMVISYDITERKRAEEALGRSEEKYRATVNLVPALLWQADARGDTIMHLARWSDYTGQTVAQIQSWGWLAAVHPDDLPQTKHAFETAFREGTPLEIEQRIRHHDGEYRWFLVRHVPVRDEPGGVSRWYGAATDIDDLVRARAAAEAASQAKDHFMAVLSHELRTPLMPITMALAMLGKRQDIPEPVRRTLEMIKRNVELEGRFIDDLLDMTRVARGKMEIVRVPMDLHTALERAVEVAAADLQAKEQPLTVALEATEHTLSGDMARLQQVFWNLLRNAAKFTPAGGVIQLRSRNEAGHIVVEVTDSGIGIEATALQRIFQPFEQANVSITQQFGGLGLGLAIAQGTVDAHDGTLRASSPGPGQGATFTVRLPLAGMTKATEATS